VGLTKGAARFLTAALCAAMMLGLLPAPAAAVNGYDSQISYVSAPSTVVRGSTYSLLVFATNTGTTTWTRGTGTQVDLANCCPVATSPNASWRSGWISDSHYTTSTQTSVAPGAIGTFAFNVTVPTSAAAGSYVFAFELVLASTNETIHPESMSFTLTLADRPAVTFDVSQPDLSFCGEKSALGDMNKDGKLDVVITDICGTPGIHILPGDGAGGFGAETFVSASVRALALGDLNGDGLLDMAVNGHVLLSNGDGGFNTITLDSLLTSIVIVDLNGDRALDLVSADSNGATVSVLLNNGTGGFSSAPGSPITVTTTSQIVEVVAGDLNGDRKPDLVVETPVDHTITVLLGNGDGSFTAQSPIALAALLDPPSAESATPMALGDVNGDGTLDLAVSASPFDLSAGLYLLLGKGDGTFTEQDLGELSTDVESLAFADFNGDGNLDLVGINGDADDVTFVIGSGDGTFATKVLIPTTTTMYGASGLAHAVGDLNADGRPDLAFGEEEGDFLVFLNTTTGAALLGTAACRRDIGDEQIVRTLLPNSTVKLVSGSTVIATTQSDAEFATYSFTGLGPNAPLTVLYAGLDNEGVFHTCNVNVTTDELGGGRVPESAPVINLGNHTWLTAYGMTAGFAVSDVIDRPFRRTFYKLTVLPQQIVTVQLTNLTRNYQLLGYSDIRAAADRLIRSITGATQAEKLANLRNLVGSGAVSAGDLDSGDLDSGDLDSGDLDSGDLDSGDLDSGDLDSGDLDSGDLDSGDLDSGDLDSGDLDSGDLDSGDLDSGYAITYQSAQRAALRYASGHAGTTPEGFTIHTRGYSGDLYFSVLGHEGAFDSGGVFQIRADVASESTACDGADLTPKAPSAVTFTTGKRTLILTNSAALDYTGTTKTALLDALGRPGGPGGLATSSLNGFSVNGFFYDLDDNANVKEMLTRVAGHPNCVPLVNLATDTIKALIWGTGSFRAANPGAEYVVFAGGDHAIPFRRVTDLTFAGEINYSPPVGGTSGASLANNTYLTDSFYLAANPVERKGQLVWLTELNGGRLVESATEILENINVYTARGGVFTPTSSLIAGYQFNTDLVDELQTGLQAGGANPVRLPDDVWGASDLRSALLAPSSPRFDVIAPQAHFTATRLIPADNGQRLLSSEIADIPASDPRFEGTVWLTIGCHSGYNIVDLDAIQPVVTAAFPEAILRHGGFLYGGTGYQFGDDEILANTELLLSNVMNEWRYRQDAAFVLYPNGQVPLGKALSNARNAYFNGLRSVRDIDRKVADVATFYGLPFYRVALASGRLDRPAVTPLSTIAIGSNGLSYSDVAASFTLTPHTGTNGGTFFDAAGIRGVTATAARPILPSTVTPIAGRLGTAPTLPHGVVLRGASYTTVANTPVLAMPQTEDTVAPPATFRNAAFSPWLFDLNVLGGDQLVFTPAQYLSDASGTSGQLRKYSSISTRVYYSTRTDASALYGSPLVRGLALTDVGGRVHVDVTLFTLGTSTAQAAMFTYTGTVAPLSTKWKTVDLVGDAPIAVQGTDVNNITVVVGHLQHWHTVSGAGVTDIDPKDGVGSSTATVYDVHGVLQAVGDTGDVVSDTNQMRLYSIPAEPATAAQPKSPTTLAFTTPPITPTTYGASASVAARLASPGVDVHGKRVIFRLGRTSVSAITGADGSVSAVVPVNVIPGSYQLEASFAEDDTLLGSFTRAPLAVDKATPAFVPTTGTATVQYSDNTSLGLLRTSTGELLRWQPVTLARTGSTQQVASFTDGTGNVRFDTMDFGLGAGTYPIVATYPGDGVRFNGVMSGTFMVTVLKEGASPVAAPVPQQTGPVTIQGTLGQDGPPADRAPGDNRLAGIHYVATNEVGTSFSGDVTPAVDGSWSFTQTVGPGVYNIVLTVTGNYYTGSSSAIAVVYDPTTFGTGGGYVLTTSATVPTVATGKKANFGFNVKYKDGTIIPTGSLLFQLKEANIDLKATSFDWLIISTDGAGKKADFQARATMNGSAGYTVHVIARDLPTGDTFSIVVTDAANNVVVSVSGAVGGGSVKVH
jgi:FG-GAP-like repeat